MSKLRSVPAVGALTTALDVRQQLPGGAVREICSIPTEALAELHQAAARLLPRASGGEAAPYAEQLAEEAEAAHVALLRLVALLEAW